MAPRIGGSERPALVVVGARADPALARRVGERAHGPVEPEPGEARGLPAAGAEAGAPEETLGLRRPERPCVAGNRCHQFLLIARRRVFLDPYFVTTSVARMPRALWFEREHQSE